MERELPRYKCHKEVHALKIAEIQDDTGPVIVPVDTRYASFRIDAEYVRKHQPYVGGYYIVYADGYKSFSPAEAFEGGYTLIE